MFGSTGPLSYSFGTFVLCFAQNNLLLLQHFYTGSGAGSPVDRPIRTPCLLRDLTASSRHQADYRKESDLSSQSPRAMASLSSLRYRSHQQGTGPLETKSGSYIYAGEPSSYHEWEFRTQFRMATAKEEDMAVVGSKIVEGLRGDALHAAMSLGVEKLKTKEG